MLLKQLVEVVRKEVAELHVNIWAAGLAQNGESGCQGIIQALNQVVSGGVAVA